MENEFELYRESIGRYLFEGRPEIYFNARLTPAQRVLIELHEHAHWQCANATIYGREQLLLAASIRGMTDEHTTEELRRCLEVTVESSRLVYEGAALVAERSLVRLGGSGPSPGWSALLEADVYGTAYSLFDHWLGRLPYAPEVLNSVAENAAELCLNSVSFLDATRSVHDPIQARDPRRLRADQVRVGLVERSPDALLRSLSEALGAQPAELVRRLDAAADHVLHADGLTAAALRSPGRLASIKPMTHGHLIYAIYETLRGFAEETGAIDGTTEYGLLQDLFAYRRADWLSKIDAGEWAGTPEPGGIRVGSPPEREVSDELEFFARIYTVVRPPARDHTTDLRIEGWGPVHEAFRTCDPKRRKLYLSVVSQPGSVEVPGSDLSCELSAARAISAPHDNFAWKFGHSRYVLEVPRAGLGHAIAEVLPYNPAVAIPFRMMDFDAGHIRDVGPLPPSATVGILLDGVSLERWAQEVERFSRSTRTMSTFYEVGPFQIPFILTFGIVDSAQWFLYSPLSLSMRHMIGSDLNLLTQIAGHGLTQDLDEIPMTALFRATSALICEQYVVNGL
jgi:hypothetical protein